GLNDLLIQSRSPSNVMVAPMVWATSPYRTQEWIAAYPSAGGGSKGFGSNRFGAVMIDQRPYMSVLDELPRLALFLYVPTTHPTFRGCSQAEVLNFRGSLSGFAPDELVFQVQHKAFGAYSLPVEIATFSPQYFHQVTPTRIPLERLP